MNASRSETVLNPLDHDSACRPRVPVAPELLSLADIHAAAERLRDAVLETPCEESEVLGSDCGCRLFLKHDHRQRTGSFKERGAANALAALDLEARARGVVAASAGNHGLGLAWHGRRLGVPVTLVMPVTAAQVKVERCRALGATVLLGGRDFAEADARGRAFAAKSGRKYVHPFDDSDVMAGQGTLGLEVVASVPDLDVVVVPVGGGGLLAGMAVAIKALRPEVMVVAVEPTAAASYRAAWLRGRAQSVAVGATFADGLAVAQVGARGLAVSRTRVDAVVTVSEEEIAWAMRRLFEVERTVAEGAGATALAAVLAGRIHNLTGRKVIVPVCGGNVDAATFARALIAAA